MQGKDGGWGAFDVDNNVDVLNQIPFGDLEAMIDPSTPDITGRVLELLGCIDYPPSSKAVRGALKFLKKTQEKDGLWWGRWGVNYIYGTWSVLTGLASIDEDMTKPYLRKAVATLKRYQNPDGGWGECCESYANRDLRMQREEHGLPDRLGSDGLDRRRRRRMQGSDQRHTVSPSGTGVRRDLGRGRVHRHRLPQALHDQVPQLSELLPPDGAREIPQSGEGGGPFRQYPGDGDDGQGVGDGGNRIHRVPRREGAQGEGI